MPLIIGIPKEIHPDERRVAATPSTVARFRKMGLDVQIEAGAGRNAGFSDADYQQAGASVCAEAAKVWANSDLVI